MISSINIVQILTAALAAIAGSQLRGSGNKKPQTAVLQTQEMTVPNEYIGCIIGKGGSKIAEIRYVADYFR